MTDMQALARMMRELEDQLVVCMRCGMCQSVCPLYSRTGLEADVARGKLALLDGLCDQLFDNPEGVSRRLDRCLLCGSCQLNCPSGVSVLEIFIKARVILFQFLRLSPALRLVLRQLLPHTQLMDNLFSWAGRLQKKFFRTQSDLLDTSCPPLVTQFFGGRHVKNLAANPFLGQLSGFDAPRGASGYRVAFFVGCLLDRLYPETARAVVSVLGKLNVGLYLPAGQVCCGIPALAAGDLETFRKLARHNLQLLQKGRWDFLVTACATCTWTIAKLWPMTAADRQNQVRDYECLAKRTLDISQFLVDRLGDRILWARKEPASQAGGLVTYHDPCHLKKSLAVADQPRALVKAAGLRLVEMEKADSCCGMGGSFNLKHYRESFQIGSLKRDRIVSSGAATVATSCPACMTQMRDVLSRNRDNIAVRHVIELLAEAI